MSRDTLDSILPPGEAGQSTALGSRAVLLKPMTSQPTAAFTAPCQTSGKPEATQLQKTFNRSFLTASWVSMFIHAKSTVA